LALAALILATTLQISVPATALSAATAVASTSDPVAAASPAPRPPTPGDPFEGFNSGVYAINLKLDKFLFRPVAVTYRRVLPRPVRNGVHNALRNWDEPLVTLNDLLQGHFSDAAHTVARFGLNTTIGLLGVLDVASAEGLPHHENGFGITLGRYGVGPGPYLFLPFAGPSTVRDLLGAGGDLAGNPLTNIRGIRSKTLERVQTVASVVDNRSRVDEDLHEIAITATDPYASLRSIYLQRVQSEINGDQISLNDSPDIPGAPELPEGKKAVAPDAPPPQMPPKSP